MSALDQVHGPDEKQWSVQEKGREGGGREEQKRGIRAMRQGGGRGGGAKPRGDERSASHVFLTGVSDLEGTRQGRRCVLFHWTEDL